jgi:hypothetical protein
MRYSAKRICETCAGKPRLFSFRLSLGLYLETLNPQCPTYPKFSRLPDVYEEHSFVDTELFEACNTSLDS